jgi:predicted permease
MPILVGRNFGPRETAAAPKSIIINETMARHYFGDQNPLWKVVYFPKVDAQGRYVPFEEAMGQDQAAEIIGVVRDAKYDNLRQATPPMAYHPWTQGIGFLSSIEIRTHGDPEALSGPARKAVTEISPSLLVTNIKTLEDQVNGTLAEERLIGKLLGMFGAIALALACVGLYGVMSYSVAQRSHEIGIRMALGARPGNMAGLILRESLLLTALGLAIGLPAALFSARLIERLLFGLRPADPLTLALAAVSMLLVAGAAGYLPARRASRVDPLAALHQD